MLHMPRAGAAELIIGGMARCILPRRFGAGEASVGGSPTNHFRIIAGIVRPAIAGAEAIHVMVRAESAVAGTKAAHIGAAEECQRGEAGDALVG